MSTPPTPHLPDPVAAAGHLLEIAERSRRLVAEFMARNAEHFGEPLKADPYGIVSGFAEASRKMWSNPAALATNLATLWWDHLTLWQRTSARLVFGVRSDPLVSAKGDRRFKDPAWDENPVFDFIKQSYLLTAQWMQAEIATIPDMDPQVLRKVEFYTKQFVDAMAPTNFVLSNPQVLRATIESGGENLFKGLENLLGDLERGHCDLRISMTDYGSFEVGGNIACTPGKVVFRNDLMELLQYSPTTQDARKRPLLVVPPWINKFYILDLGAKKSFVRWAVAQGHTVFVISWINPDASLAHKRFEDYLGEGVVAALDAIEAHTGEPSVNAIGYCLGGTLLASTLAWLTAKKKANRIASATVLTTMLDFSEPGELNVFLDDGQVTALEVEMDRTGYLDGSKMATAFNMLRANDLIWSFVVENYLLGKTPFPFDLLYWNSDSTRMPAAMHSFYLRKMYLENRLAQPKGITLAGVPVDLRAVKTPAFFLSAREDHIAPWTSTYLGTHLLGGPKRFVLAGSGHIAGVVNPPEANRYGYWTNDDTPWEADAWLAGAKENAGSWWSEWDRWVAGHSGGTVPARMPEEGRLPILGDAPGTYVKIRDVTGG